MVIFTYSMKDKDNLCYISCKIFKLIHLSILFVKLKQMSNTGQSVSIPRHSQTRTKHADLVTLET